MAAGKLSFTQTEFRIREDGTYIGAKVSVERTEGNVGLVSVKVTNSSASSLGRATRKLDFLPINPTTSTGSSQLLTWADGEGGIKTLEFTIIQENLVEGDEFIPLSLGSYKGGAVAGEIPKCSLIIVDDDSAKGIQGIQGEKGEKGEGIRWKGVWQYGPYQVGDLVSYFDAVEWAVYICTNPPVINYPIGLTEADYSGFEDSSIFPNVSPSWELFCKGANGRDGRDYIMTFKGVWNPETLYVQRDAVLFNGSSYVCIKENGRGRNPVSEPTFWALVAQGTQVFFGSGFATLKKHLFACRTSDTAGGTRTFPHGLSSSVIKNYSAVLTMSEPVGQFGYAPLILPGGFRTLPGYSYDIAVNNSHIVIVTTPSDSSKILSKEVFVTLDTF
ncbi:hypothetical protein [Planktothrix paucivesiculata]|uniref:ProA (Modular protein) n=1 Tax=Planktothrix paucivesiculata PCC 9631 TaxID=671071 RepID=A0A7Z9BK18_9CYAN|nr:hypothetical protein [Planktothrix paucivesiculata]VXD15498.1 ProA (modular protein) [Planktothrix paucivesiculata PCC 9631]